jgi:transposase
MANKINVKLILELRDAKMSQNSIASTRHISRNSVSDVFHIVDSMGITYNDVRTLDEQQVYRMFFPDKHAVEDMYHNPNYDYVHKELKRVGVTLKLLWNEYKDKCKTESSIPMGYTKYCEGYGDYTTANKLTSHLEHKPGIIIEVDWSGPTMSYVDTDTGEMITVYLFVATLPYSQYSYVEPCLDMKQDTWLRCHIHMYEFFEGASIRTVCDNLKTGVISHPKEGDMILNEAYEALGSHYMTAIMPAGVRKPKHKPSVEGTVGKVATAIIARLRNEGFQSFHSLKKAVREKLNEFNHQPFQKREYSRYEVFQEEKVYLHALPDIPYEIANWVYG